LPIDLPPAARQNNFSAFPDTIKTGFARRRIMKCRLFLCAFGVGLSLAAACSAAQIQGEYLEARSCDVYTGPCFANAEMDLAGKEAVMAWHVEEGSWDGVNLAGLSVAVVATSEKTMGDTGVFKMRAGRIRSVILVDDQATTEQKDALVAFAKASATDYTQEVTEILCAPMSLDNDHVAGKGVFRAGDIAKIETRALKKGDCVCTNEIVFYQPLTKIENALPAYSRTLSYTGAGLDAKFTTNGKRSAFLGTFRK
jgi:hypothetical protein